MRFVNSSVLEDDMFDDEQPVFSKGSVPKVSIPVIEYGWATDGKYRLVGNGKVTNEFCGRFFSYKGCPNVDLHNRIMVDGVNYSGKVYVKKVFCSCNRPSCPVCYEKGWAVREAGNIEARLKEARKRFGLVEHLCISVPVRDYGFELRSLRRKAIKILLELGVVGGVMIFHAFRFDSDKRIWYFSPHFHILGFIAGGYSCCRHCKGGDCYACDGFDGRTYRLYRKNGYIVTVFGKRETVGGTAFYQLNHSSYKIGAKRFHIATWFGVCSYRKLKVTVERRKAICPICQHDLDWLWYHGGKYFVLNRESPEFERESFEDFMENGHAVWSIRKFKRSWDSGSSEDLVGHEY